MRNLDIWTNLCRSSKNSKAWQPRQLLHQVCLWRVSAKAQLLMQTLPPKSFRANRCKILIQLHQCKEIKSDFSDQGLLQGPHPNRGQARCLGKIKLLKPAIVSSRWRLKRNSKSNKKNSNKLQQEALLTKRWLQRAMRCNKSSNNSILRRTRKTTSTTECTNSCRVEWSLLDRMASKNSRKSSADQVKSSHLHAVQCRAIYLKSRTIVANSSFPACPR